MESITPEMLNANRVFVVDDAEIKQFVGKRSGYYFSQWKAFYGANPPLKVCWNWAALLMGPFWLGYRKMYGYATIYMFMILAFDIIQIHLQVNLIEPLKCGFLWMLGIIGNNLYYRYTRRKIYKNKTGNPSFQISVLSKIGGRSWAGVGYVILLMLACEIGLNVYKIVLDIVMDF
jgi:hypothetical protein